jgi:putative heme-binding domain-containing protein
MRVLLLLAVALVGGTYGTRAEGKDALTAIIQVLGESDDAQLQLDILKGLNDGFKGRREVKMPGGWEKVASKLSRSPNAAVRELAQNLSLTFGSEAARAALRERLDDRGADLQTRTNALEALLGVKDPELPETLQKLLKEPSLRSAALRGLAAYDHPQTPLAILQIYPELGPLQRKDALSTLISRAAFAKALLQAVSEKKIPARDLTAEFLRQLRNLNDPAVAAEMARNFGVARETAEDKAREIARYKGMIQSSSPGDPSRGRAVFNRTCAQCHVLFDTGGKVGPELTGSNRGDLDYIMQNILDPNAVIPNDFRTSTLETKDDRVITGIVTRQDANAITIVTANETLVVPRIDLQSLTQGEISMMPEGLLQALSDGEVRDLVAYLRSPTQVPLPKE